MKIYTSVVVGLKQPALRPQEGMGRTRKPVEELLSLIQDRDWHWNRPILWDEALDWLWAPWPTMDTCFYGTSNFIVSWIGPSGGAQEEFLPHFSSPWMTIQGSDGAGVEQIYALGLLPSLSQGSSLWSNTALWLHRDQARDT